MKREYSAGIIVYYDDEKTGIRQYLLLHYPRGHWDLAKGKIEKNESKIETAKRELKEEAGIEAEIDPRFEETLTYFFRDKQKELVHKEVTFFVGKALSNEVTISEEHIGYVWLPFKEAVHKLTFTNAQKVISLAHQFLEAER